MSRHTMMTVGLGALLAVVIVASPTANATLVIHDASDSIYDPVFMQWLNLPNPSQYVGGGSHLYNGSGYADALFSFDSATPALTSWSQTVDTMTGTPGQQTAYSEARWLTTFTSIVSQTATTLDYAASGSVESQYTLLQTHPSNRYESLGNQSQLSFIFTIDTPYRVTLSGDMSQSLLPGMNEVWISDWQHRDPITYELPNAYQATPNGYAYYDEDYNLIVGGYQANGTFADDLVLGPGTYTFGLRAQTSLNGAWPTNGITTLPDNPYQTAGFNLSLELTPVPEPISMVMLGCLGAGMVAARKLRRQKS